MRCRIVIEQAGDNFSAYVPDLPGCVATGATREEAERNIVEAIRFHLDGLREDDDIRSIDPFVAFTEWAGDVDSTDYANL